MKKGRRPVALFVDEAHDLLGKTLTGLKRIMEGIEDGGGQLSVVLAGHPKLDNDLRKPTMEEIGYAQRSISTNPCGEPILSERSADGAQGLGLFGTS